MQGWHALALLGTGLWADASIITEPALDGGWYAAPPPEVRGDFEKRFQALYKHSPPLLATHAVHVA